MKFSKYYLFNKILKNYVICIVSSVLIIGVILFNLFGIASSKSINEQIIKQLGNVSYIYDIINEQVWEIYTSIRLNKKIDAFLSLKESNPVIEYHAFLELHSFQNLASYINYIGVYNANYGKFLNTKNFDEEDFFEIANSDAFKNSHMVMFEPITFYYPYSDETLDPPNNVLCSMFKFDTKNEHAIVICVNQTYIMNNIKKIERAAQSNIYVLNKKGIILSDSQNTYFGQPFNNIFDIEDILISEQREGSLSINVEGDKLLVSYVKQPNSGWIFIDVQKYADVFSNIYSLGGFALISCVMIIIIFTSVSFILTNKIYTPINRLISKINNSNLDMESKKRIDEIEILSKEHDYIRYRLQMMERSLYNSKKIIRERVLICLLKGIYREIPRSISSYKEIEKELKANHYMVIAFKIDDFAEYKKHNNLETIEITKYAILNIVNEVISMKSKNKVVEIEFNLFAVMLQLDEKFEMEEYKENLQTIQSVIRENFEVDISFGIGITVSNLKDICISFDIAKNNLDYTFVFGFSSIIDTSMIEEYVDVSPRYPYSLERDIIKFINLGYEKELEEKVKIFMKQIAQFNYKNIIDFSKQLLTSIISIYHDELADKLELRKYYAKMNMIINSQTIDEMTKETYSFCLDLCRRPKNDTILKHKKIVEGIIEYINNNFQDPSICLDAVADKYKLSKDYLATIFKNSQKISFNEYIYNLRMKKAAELLLSTDKSVSQIAKEVGIYNTSYFYTLFKKAYGTTPASYRKMQLLRDNYR